MGFIVRKMTIADIAGVQKVADKSWHATYEGIIPLHIQENFLAAAYSDEMLEKRLQRSLFLVAEVKGKIVGFANFTFPNEEGVTGLAAIYIYPEYQGNGLGSALLQKGISSLDHVRKIFLDVEKENEIGKTFYTAKGFKIVKEFDDDFEGHILKTVRMLLEI